MRLKKIFNICARIKAIKAETSGLFIISCSMGNLVYRIDGVSVNLYNRNMTDLKKFSSNEKFQLVFLYVSAFFAQTAIGMINLALIFFMKNTMGHDPEIVGLFAGVVSVAYCISLITLKKYTERLKPRHAVEIASAGMFVSGVMIVLLQNTLAAFFLYALYGVCMAFLWPPLMAWISRGREGRALGKGLAGFNLAWSFGFIIGPYSAGIIAETSAAAAVYTAAGISGFLLLLMAVVTASVPSLHAAESSRTLQQSSRLKDSSTPYRYLSWIGVFSAYFVFGVVMNIFPMYAQDILSYREGTIGFMLFVRGAATTLFFVLLGKMSFWHYNFSSILSVQLIFAAGCIWAMFISSFWAILLFFIFFGLMFSSLYTFSIFHGVSGSIHREKRMAIHESVLTAGVLSGSVLGGFLYSWTTYQMTMAAAAVIALTAAVLQITVFVTKISGNTAADIS